MRSDCFVRLLAPGSLVVAACWLVQQLPQLPGRPIAIGLLLLGLLLLWVGRVGLLAGTALSSFAWAVLQAHAALDQRLPQALDGVEVVVVGVVEEMPQAFERGLSFRFRLESCVGPEEPCPQPALIRVSWHNATLFGKVSQPLPHIEPGQRWQLNLRLRRPHASVNPGLFDAELRALQERLAAVAYVRKARPGYPNVQMPSGLAGPMHQVERLRLLLREKMHAVLAGASKEASSVLVALVIGDQAAISASWWELFNRTGIGHLMSISGLHITMLAALAGGLARRIWRCERLAQWMYPRALPSLMPEPRARWLFGVTAAFGYSLLAGWGIPAQRTCWMLAVAGLAFCTGRARSAPAVICTAAAGVCLMDPWAPMAAGFWLSFAAVAAIIWHGSRSLAASAETSGALQPASGPHHLQDPSRRSLALIESVARAWRVKLAALLRAAARTQLAATVVLLPLGVLFFATVSLASPIANAIAIPLVSALFTPLAMAGATLALGYEWWGGLARSRRRRCHHRRAAVHGHAPSGSTCLFLPFGADPAAREISMFLGPSALVARAATKPGSERAGPDRTGHRPGDGGSDRDRRPTTSL
ncbi:MAG: ComEC/Rec2 family competence protein [Quisquiliibacterium sp.]